MKLFFQNLLSYHFIRKGKFFIYPLDVYENHSLSFSQEGEDIFLARYFSSKSDGFYVDVGAFHPTKYSNTYKFYLKGWRGINVDPNQKNINLFNRIRIKDINICAAISQEQGKLEYFSFECEPLNTCSPLVAHERIKQGCKLISHNLIQSRTLSEILDSYLPSHTKTIDFFSVDCEGMDLDVLRSNDWSKYRPVFVLVEDLSNNISFQNLLSSELVLYMEDQEYVLHTRLVKTVIFKRSDYT